MNGTGKRKERIEAEEKGKEYVGQAPLLTFLKSGLYPLFTVAEVIPMARREPDRERMEEVERADATA